MRLIFGDQLDIRLWVLRGWCDPLGAPRPLGPLTDALSGLGAALAAAVESGDTAGIYRTLLAALGDGGRWVWVIEDAHCADGATPNSRQGRRAARPAAAGHIA